MNDQLREWGRKENAHVLSSTFDPDAPAYGELDYVEETAKHACAQAEHTFGPADPIAIEALVNLGLFYWYRHGARSNAAKPLRRALALLRASDHPPFTLVVEATAGLALAELLRDDSSVAKLVASVTSGNRRPPPGAAVDAFRRMASEAASSLDHPVLQLLVTQLAWPLAKELSDSVGPKAAADVLDTARRLDVDLYGPAAESLLEIDVSLAGLRFASGHDDAAMEICQRLSLTPLSTAGDVSPTALRARQIAIDIAEELESFEVADRWRATLVGELDARIATSRPRGRGSMLTFLTFEAVRTFGRSGAEAPCMKCGKPPTWRIDWHGLCSDCAGLIEIDDDDPTVTQRDNRRLFLDYLKGDWTVQGGRGFFGLLLDLQLATRQIRASETQLAAAIVENALDGALLCLGRFHPITVALGLLRGDTSSREFDPAASLRRLLGGRQPSVASIVHDIVNPTDPELIYLTDTYRDAYMARVAMGEGDLVRSAEILEEVVARRRSAGLAGGTIDAEFAADVELLADVYRLRGELRKGDEILQAALAGDYGRLPVGTQIGFLHRQAELLMDIGYWTRAQECLMRAMALVGEEGEANGHELHDMELMLGSAHLRAGELAKARAAVSHLARKTGRRGTELWAPRALCLMADCDAAAGDYAGAETTLRRALSEIRQVRGLPEPGRSLRGMEPFEREPDGQTAWSVQRRLAALHAMTGRLASALALSEHALDQARRYEGVGHPTFAAELGALSRLYLRVGQYPRARALTETIVGVLSTKVGTRDVRYSSALLDQAEARARDGDAAGAMDAVEESVAATLAVTSDVFGITDDSFRVEYARSTSRAVSLATSIVLLDGPSPVDPARALQIVLRTRGLAAQASSAQRRAVLSGRYPQLSGLIEELEQVRLRLVELQLPLLMGTSTPSAQRDHLLDSLVRTRSELEVRLARRVPETAGLGDSAAMTADLALRRLPDDAVLLEFVEYDHFGEGLRYAVYALREGGEPPAVVSDLGPAGAIDRLVRRIRAGLLAVDGSEGEEPIFLAGDEPADDAERLTRQNLTRTLVEPVVAAAGGARRLVVVPEGTLAHLPFEILPLRDGRALIDAYEVSYLTTGRDLWGRAAREPSAVQRPVVIGAPDFGRPVRRRGHGLGVFAPLPDTAVEVRAVANLLRVDPIVGKEARPDVLLDLGVNPQVLHVATHGFFLADAVTVPPMLRSGLALAGANLARSDDEGIVTAEAIAALNLSGTRLVVLSACDTGLGEIQVGEGIFGLRRALLLAGAWGIVMTLWKVPDRQTRSLMVDFYRRATGGQSTSRALHDAQLALRREYPDAFFWGAFIYLGDPDVRLT